MKKRRYLTLFILILSLLAACGGEGAAPEPTGAPDTAETGEMEETAVEPTAAPAEEEPAPTEVPAADMDEDPPSIVLATTTSTEDAGLLGEILPIFTEEAGIEVDVIAVGTGQALELGENGDADVLLVHARAREDAFMEAGHGARREDVMYNDFVIVGPPEDPAGISGMNRAPRALEEIAAAEAPFVSRGDDSGTHTKEKAIWEEAGITPEGDWYISAGQGMGAVLTMADEQQAYTLTDRATYLARTLEGTSLEIMVEGDPILFNPYGVMAVNPDKGDHIKNDLANQFIDWLISAPTQEIIAEYGTEQFGNPLFTPDSEPWREAHGGGEESGEAGGEDAPIALTLSGMVDNGMAWTEEEIRSLDTMDAEAVNNSGETETYTGVPINALLEMGGVQDGATTVILTTDEGESIELPLADLAECADCILSFRNQGGFSTTLPAFADLPRLRDVTEIQVQ